MKNSIGVLVASFFLHVLLVSAFAVEPMEPVAQQAKSLDDFLRRSVLVESYQRALREYLGKDKYPCESFGEVTNRLKTFNKKFPELAERLWRPVTHLPAMKVEREGKHYFFRPVSRKLHAIWADASGDGCPVDGCEAANGLAPSRWTALVEGAEFFWVEKDGKFFGTSVWVLPIQRNGEKYGLVSLLGPPLKTAAEDREVLYLWWELMKPHLPKEWRTMLALVPQNDEFPVPMMKELNPKEKRALAIAREFEPTEALEEIAKAFPRQCYARTAALGMDLFFGDTVKGELTALAIPTGDDPKKTEQWLLSFGGLPPADVAAKADNDQLRKYSAALSFQLAKSPNPTVRSRAAIALGDVLKNRAVDLPAYRGPASGTARPIPFTAPLTVALKDSDPGVRAAAAVSLANNGASSPAIQRQLGQTLGPKSVAQALQPGAVPWGKPDALLDRVPSKGLPPGSFGGLFREANRLTDPRARERALDRLADRFRTEGGQEELDEISRELQALPPRERQQIADSINQSDAPCPADRQLDELINVNKTRQSARTVIRAGAEVPFFGPNVCNANDSSCGSNDVPLGKLLGGHTGPEPAKGKEPPNKAEPKRAVTRGAQKKMPISCEPSLGEERFTRGASFVPAALRVYHAIVKKNAEGGYDLAANADDPDAECLFTYFHATAENPSPAFVGVLANYDRERPELACILKAAQFGLPYTGLVTTVAGLVLRLPCSLEQGAERASAWVVSRDGDAGKELKNYTADWSWLDKMLVQAGEIAKKTLKVTGNLPGPVGLVSRLANQFIERPELRNAVSKPFAAFGNAVQPYLKKIDAPEKTE